MGGKVEDLTALPSAADGDLLYIIDVSAGPTGKSITVSNLLANVPVGSHVHSADDITSGLLTHEHGGLEFDASGGSDGQVLTKQSDGSIAWEDAVGGALDSIELKSSVKAATTANIALSGEKTLDGIPCFTGDRVLVKDQTDASENGIYIVSDYGSWPRADDLAADSSAAATFGHIQQGGEHGDRKWLCTNNTGTDTVGTDDLVFEIIDADPAGEELAASTAGPTIEVDTINPGGVGLGNEIQGIRIVGATGGTFALTFNGQTTGAIDFDATNTEVMTALEALSNVESGDVIVHGPLDSYYKYQVVFDGNFDGVDVPEMTADGTNLVGSNVQLDWSQSRFYRLTLNGNLTLAFEDGDVGLMLLKLIQDGTGSRTVTWPANVKWAGGTEPTLSTGAGDIDLIQFYWDGTDYYGSVIGLDFQVPV